MIKANWIAGLLALALFVNAQYQGWNLFEGEAGNTGSRAGSGRVFHK